MHKCIVDTKFIPWHTLSMTSTQSMSQNVIYSIVATDIFLLTLHNNALWVKLIHVERPPHFPGVPGLPGGLVLPTETAEQSALRHLREKTKMISKDIYIEQLQTMSEITRDPRGRVVSVAYLALCAWDALSDSEKENTQSCWWERFDKLPSLAYDHNTIVSIAMDRLAAKVRYSTILSKLLPKLFTLTQLEKVFEMLTGEELDKRNFRKKIRKLNIVKKTSAKITDTVGRPAALYRFISQKVRYLDII